MVIPSNWFRFFIRVEANCGPLSEIIDSGNPCIFHTFCKNNSASPIDDVSSWVGMKWTIFVNRSHTTSMLSYPFAFGSLVIKSAVMCVHGMVGASFGRSFPGGGFVIF